LSPKPQLDSPTMQVPCANIVHISHRARHSQFVEVWLYVHMPGTGTNDPYVGYLCMDNLESANGTYSDEQVEIAIKRNTVDKEEPT